MIHTLFVSDNECLVVYWKSHDAITFPSELIPEFISAELQEAYQNVLETLESYYQHKINWGLTISEKSLQVITQKKLYLSGESMGLAWLIGGLCFLHQRPFPADLLAWGAIRPLRNGQFSLYPTDHTDKKLKLVLSHAAQRITTHKDEQTSSFPGKRIVLGNDMMGNINIIKEKVLQCFLPQ